MKKQLFACSVAIAVILMGLFIFSVGNSKVEAGPALPTPPPTKTEGPPIIVKATYTLLDQPLTSEQAVARAFKLDSKLAIWDDPWSPESLKTDPDRISVEWHSDRTYSGNEYGSDAEVGPLWVITIKGSVHLPAEDPPDKKHDGLTYRIAQNTGNFLGYGAGAWVK